jgi:hypothetical protein
MRVGYHYWGFLGDHKLDNDGTELSTPDGNATYSANLIAALQLRGHDVYMMSKDRDMPAVDRLGLRENFRSHNQDVRSAAYGKSILTNGVALPELDVLILEWRFPIPGRNCSESDPIRVHSDRPEGSWSSGLGSWQPDLKRQWELIGHYRKSVYTKVYVWDLDHKLTKEDECLLYNLLGDRIAVLETSQEPKRGVLPRIRVEFPAWPETFLEHKTFPSLPEHAAAYIGSRYERDDVIDEWIAPLSKARPGAVRFYGKWDNDARERWPHIAYSGRITTSDFREAYRYASCVPLLAKRSYMDCGFVTPRPYEALIFGSLPIGFAGHLGIHRYCLDVATSPIELLRLVGSYSRMRLEDKDRARKQLAEKLEFMDARNFVTKLGL